jgi:hypothetical protein
MFRLRFEVGEFYCYTPIFGGKKLTSYDLEDSFCIDLHEDTKYLKITLLALNGRPSPNNQFFNEFLNEQEISFVTIKVKEFEEQKNDISHTIQINKLFYNPKDPIKADSILLTAGFALM